MLSLVKFAPKVCRMRSDERRRTYLAAPLFSVMFDGDPRGAQLNWGRVQISTAGDRFELG